MNYLQYLEKTRPLLGNYCKGCQVCNGRACSNMIPGPGAKGKGTVAVENFEAWSKIKLVIDTINENFEPDSNFEIFGKKFNMPIFAGPVGAVNMHYGNSLSDLTYNKKIVTELSRLGIAAFTGDGLDENIMIGACDTIKENMGIGIPTIKPWNMDIIKAKATLVKNSGAFACAMDIDAAGLPFLKNMNPPAGSKSISELQEIIEYIKIPFIVKGVLSVAGAQKALEAGASAIVISNHGGRVLDDTVTTASVLEEIADFVDSRMKIFVDGGIRSGNDVFKAIALGADAVIIARPFVISNYGDFNKFYIDKLHSELIDTMKMCGAKDLKSIRKNMIRKPV